MLTTYRITLTGGEQVPPVSTSAHGIGTAIFDSTNSSLFYTISTTGLDWGPALGLTPQTVSTADDVNGQHFHSGARGVNGPVVFDWLAADTDDFQAVLNSSGSWTISGTWETTDPGSTIASFASALQNTAPGADAPLYANIHTVTNAGGEIRGQLVGASSGNENIAILITSTFGSECQTATYLSNATVSSRTSKAINLHSTSVVQGSQLDITLEGNGLTYNGSGDVTGGTIMSVLINPTSLGQVVSTSRGFTINAVTMYNAIIAHDQATLDMLLFQSGTINYTGDTGNDIFTGSTLADTLAGGAGNDSLNGRAGNDTIDGGTGIDTAVFSGLRSAYTLTAVGGNGLQVSGPDDTDTLTNIEKLAFSDVTLARPGTDFSGDFRGDLLWQNNNGTAAIWTMNGATPVTGAAVSPNPGPSWHLKGAADFNGDGKPDLLWQNDDGTVAIWTMNGVTPVSGSVVSPNPGTAWHLITAADFTGDGQPDLLWQNNDGTAAIWTMNGVTPTTGNVISPNPGAAWHLKGAADFNGDGKLDLLWQNDDGSAAIWTMNGVTPVSGTTVSPNPGTSWHLKDAADFTDDGKPDLLWQNDNGSVAIWTMNGVTPTSGTVVSPNPGVDWHLIA